ncbi:MAG: transporter substrate-binding domain-containing protein [Thermodesulfobacteriota bacterium]
MRSGRVATPPEVTAPLRVGTSGDYPPFSVHASDGTLDGFDVAVARAYARDRERPLELVAFAWPDLERRLVAGDFDVAMSGVTVRGDRLVRGPMTAAVARTSAVLVAPARATSSAAPAADDGAGLTVAVNRGGHLERVARTKLPRATIVTLEDNRRLAAVLASGEVDGVVTDTLELRSFATPGEPQPRVLRVLSDDRKAYWAAPSATALAEDLDAWLAAREADGSLARLRASYGVVAADPSASPVLDGPTARLVDLLARRLLLMPEVADAKRVAGLPVDAPARERVVYEREREAAACAGLAPEPYVDLVREEIEIAKDVQRATLVATAAVDCGEEPGARARWRLEHELRPAIDTLDRAIRTALVAAAPVRAEEAELAAAVLRDAPVPGFGREQAVRLAGALRRIPAPAAVPPAPCEIAS